MNPNDEQDLKKITSIVSSQPKINEIILFGSRAKGVHRPSSDWDLAIKGRGLTLSDVMNLHVKLDELWLACAIDLVIYDSIENKALKDHINRVGIVVWTSPKE